MKILTVYFSKTGHTKAIAEMIHKAVGGELGEIRTKRSYAPSYGMAVLQGGWEQLRKSLPELAEMPDTAEYDVICVGSPVWWFTLTPAVKSFISKAEWKGKRIYPFFTSGGQPGKTANDFKRLLEDKGALVGGSLSVPYKRNLPQRPVDEIIRWAEENKFEE